MFFALVSNSSISALLSMPGFAPCASRSRTCRLWDSNPSAPGGTTVAHFPFVCFALFHSRVIMPLPVQEFLLLHLPLDKLLHLVHRVFVRRLIKKIYNQLKAHCLVLFLSPLPPAVPEFRGSPSFGIFPFRKFQLMQKVLETPLFCLHSFVGFLLSLTAVAYVFQEIRQNLRRFFLFFAHFFFLSTPSPYKLYGKIHLSPFSSLHTQLCSNPLPPRLPSRIRGTSQAPYDV